MLAASFARRRTSSLPESLLPELAWLELHAHRGEDLLGDPEPSDLNLVNFDSDILRFCFVPRFPSTTKSSSESYSS